ncbi:MAG: S1C family serine protease [Bacteroidales bacterium]
MKKLTFTIAIIIFSLQLFAQKENFSIINFIASNAKFYINEQLIGETNDKEVLQYKIFSEGHIKIIIVRSLFDNTSYNIDVKRNDTIYCEYNRGFVSKEKGEAWMEKFKLIEEEEDPANPVITKRNISGPKQGTCFLINKQGYLLTNYHVISDAKKIQVKGIGNDFSTDYGAEVVAIDADLDLALLKLKNQNVQFENTPYKISIETNPQGTKSFVLGYPMAAAMGEEIKLTEGIVSAKSGYKGTISQYQFSAAIQPGNSGSPLFNDNGDIIGITDAKLRGAEGAGYAIKSAYILTFLKLAENITLDNNATSISNLPLVEKAAKLKNYIFIVKAE